MGRFLLASLLLVLVACGTVCAGNVNLKHIHSAIVEANGELVELENVERDPTQFYLTWQSGDRANGLINITQRSPCFNVSSPDCGKQAQDSTFLLRVKNGLVYLAQPIINNPTNQSFGLATDGRAHGYVKADGKTYIYFAMFLRILRTIGTSVYDTTLHIPSEIFGQFDMQTRHFTGYVGALTVPFLEINDVSDGQPYQSLATWAVINTSQNPVSRLAGFRALTPYTGLTPSPYKPAAFSFVQGGLSLASEQGGVYRAQANLSTASGLVHITNANLIGAVHENKDYDNGALMRFAMLSADVNGVSKRFVAANLYLDLIE